MDWLALALQWEQQKLDWPRSLTGIRAKYGALAIRGK